MQKYPNKLLAFRALPRVRLPVPLKGGYCKIYFPIGHNIWWENSQNGSFGPKHGPKMQKRSGDIFRPKNGPKMQKRSGDILSRDILSQDIYCLEIGHSGFGIPFL